MKKTFYKYLIFPLFILLSFNLISQSVDPPNAKTVVEGEGHAVIKAHSLGYLNDSTEIKLTNINSVGEGTEFVIKSLNETGLSINSNSDLSANTTDSILFLQPDGDVIIGKLKGGGSRPLFVDDDGQIRAGCPTTFAVYETNISAFTTTATGYQAVGPSYSYTKDCNESILKIRLSDRMFYDEVNEVAASIQVRVNGIVPHYSSDGSVWDANDTGSNKLNTWYSTESIYENLSSGTYTLQIYVNISGGGEGTIDPGNFISRIIVEETH